MITDDGNYDGGSGSESDGDGDGGVIVLVMVVVVKVVVVVAVTVLIVTMTTCFAYSKYAKLPLSLLPVLILPNLNEPMMQGRDGVVKPW